MQHHGVFLQIVSDTRNVTGTFDLVGQTDPRDLAKRGIGLLGRGRLDTQAYAAFLRAALQDGRG